MSDLGEFTQLLVASRSGDQAAWNSLVKIVYADLQRVARRQRVDHAIPTTLGTTGLVHECYLRLAGAARANVENRQHFMNLASRVMRQVLCDYARRALRSKRGGGVSHEDLDAVDPEVRSEAENLVWIDDMLARLESENPVWARIVECRYFAALTDQETSEALGIPLRSVQRQWHDARQWLAEKMK